MAAPAFVSATAHAGNPTTSATVTLPTTAANDILIVTVNNGGANAAPTMTTGTFTGTLAALGTGAGWTSGWGGVFWARCTGNHSGQTIIASGATDSCSLQVVRYSGCITTGNPYDTNISQGTVAAGANATLTAFTTTVAETLVVLSFSIDDNQTVSSPTKNAVAMNNLSQASSTGGADSAVGTADLAQAAAGTTGNFAITVAAGTNQGKRMTAFALVPPTVTTVNLTVAAETDTAQPLVATKPISLEVAESVAEAQALLVTMFRSLGVATETDAAVALSRPTTTTVGEVSLAAVTDPGDDTLHALGVRARVTSAVSGTLKLRLYEGATARSAEYETAPLTTSLANYLLPLTEAEAASIGDYGNLSIRFRGVSAVGDPAEFEIAEMWLQTPLSEGGPVTLTRALETDTALALTAVKQFSLGVATETESALAVSATFHRTLGVASESDTAQAVTFQKRATLGLAAETDTGQALSLVVSRTLTAATETDAALGVTFNKRATLTQAGETDAAQPLTAFRSKSLAVVAETDAALAVTATKQFALGVAAETDVAQALTFSKPVTLGLVSETDAAQALTVQRVVSLGLASETDSALAATFSYRATLGPAAESDLAVALGVSGTQSFTLGIATEVDAAVGLTWVLQKALGVALETDTTQPISASRLAQLVEAVETDQALALSPQRQTLGPAEELDEAVALSSMERLIHTSRGSTVLVLNG
jgi:hypothetical protein